MWSMYTWLDKECGNFDGANDIMLCEIVEAQAIGP